MDMAITITFDSIGTGIRADLGGTVTHRDLATTPLPQVDGAWADARLTDPTEMGTLFKAIAFYPNGTTPPPGFSQ